MADWRRDFSRALEDSGAGPVVLLTDVPLAGRTTFGIGGKADCWVEVSDLESLKTVLRCCRSLGVEWWVLGQGSNVLVSDQGLRGVVLRLRGRFEDIETTGTTVRAGAGALLDDVARAAERSGLFGASFLAGIPGTVGGGLRSNAGAFGHALAEILERVVVLRADGEVRELGETEFGRGYRQPVIDAGLVATEVTLKLSASRPEAAPAPVREIRAKRRAKQPGEPSAGSFFKNPASEPAGRLVERCGLKGRRVGGAQVSERHANFIVNTGCATFGDVYELVQVVKAEVEKATGVRLEEEVELLPGDGSRS